MIRRKQRKQKVASHLSTSIRSILPKKSREEFIDDDTKLVVNFSALETGMPHAQIVSRAVALWKLTFVHNPVIPLPDQVEKLRSEHLKK